MKYKIKIKKTMETIVVVDKNNQEEVEQWVDYAVQQNGIKFDDSTVTTAIEYLH